jgi:hypothetical protein
LFAARKTRPTEAHRPRLRTTLGELAREEAGAQLALGLRALVREDLRDFVISAGVAALAAVWSRRFVAATERQMAEWLER